jgi:hypothetical protein
VCYADTGSFDILIATTGANKLRAATATAALITDLFPKSNEALNSILRLVVNVGIVGSSTKDLAIGTLTYINKVRDVATNRCFYPDIIVKHPLPERHLDTYDEAVTSPPKEPVLVDMEGSGFFQAAGTFLAPSSIALLKVVSDYTDSTEANWGNLTPSGVHNLIDRNTDNILNTLTDIATTAPQTKELSSVDVNTIDIFSRANKLSVSQRIELTRIIRSLNATGTDWRSKLVLSMDNKTADNKSSRNTYFRRLTDTLTEDLIP